MFLTFLLVVVMISTLSSLNLFAMVFALMVLVFLSTAYMVVNNILSILLSILVLTIYLGGMMILMGYVSAVRPNTISSGIYWKRTLAFSLTLPTMPHPHYPLPAPVLDSGEMIVDEIHDVVSFFLFTPFGAYLFLALTVILLSTLFMMSSNLIITKGRLRAVTPKGR